MMPTQFANVPQTHPFSDITLMEYLVVFLTVVGFVLAIVL